MLAYRFGQQSSILLRSARLCAPTSSSYVSNVNVSFVAIARSGKRFYSNSTSPQAYLESLSDIEPFTKEEEQVVKGISILTLDRPEAKNAISQKMIKELEECIEKVHFDRSIRVLILRSKVQNTFCAGADLKERKQMSPLEVDQFLASLRKTFSSLENLPLPTLTALDGLAMGGGMELALCTDLRFSTESTDKLGLPETKLGIIPGAGGTFRMTKLIGPSRTKELVFSARMLNGKEAFELGIIDKLAPKAQTAFQTCIQSAKLMAQNGPLALRAAKAAISKGQSLDTETALDWERACYEKCLASKDRLEGLKAFAEKRKPVYTGE